MASVPYTELAISAIKYRDKDWAPQWRRYSQIMGNRWYSESDSVPGQESPTVNLVAARCRSVAPKVAMNNPIYKVESVMAPPFEQTEEVLGKVLTDIYRREKMGRTTKLCADDMTVMGMGIGFVGYEANFAGKPTTEALRNPFAVVAKFTELVREVFTDKAASEAQALRDELRQLLSERIFLERVSPLNFFIDPTASEWNNAAFMGRTLYLTKEDALALTGKDLSADSAVNVWQFDGEQKQKVAEIDDVALRVKVYEMWHLPSGKTVYLDSDKKVLKVEEWKSAYPGFPFVPMPWDDVPDCVFPEGMAAGIEPLNKELHIMRKRQLQEARKAMRKFIVSAGLSQDAREALTNDLDGQIVELEDHERAEAITFALFNPEFWNLENAVRGDINEISHTSEYDSGSAPTGDTTATEAAFIQSTSNAMSQYRQMTVEQFAVGVGERVLAALLTVFDKPMAVKLEDGSTYDFVGTDHLGAYRVTIEDGSMLAQAKDIERQQFIAIANQTASLDFIDNRQVWRTIFGMFPSIKDAEQFILDESEMPPPPEPAPTPEPQMGIPPQYGGFPPMTQGIPAMLPAEPSLGMGGPTAEGDMLAALGGQMNAPLY